MVSLNNKCFFAGSLSTVLEAFLFDFALLLLEMSKLLPQFHHHVRRDGTKVLGLGYSEEAKRAQQNPPQRTTCLQPDVVWKKALEAVQKFRGDVNNELHVLGQHEVQFGVFHGKTFVWVLTNALGYAGFIVDKIVNIDKEKETWAPLSKNKFLFKTYVEKFEQGLEAVQMKQKEREKTASAKTAAAVTQLLNKNAPPSLVVKRALASKSVRPIVRANVSSARSSTATAMDKRTTATATATATVMTTTTANVTATKSTTVTSMDTMTSNSFPAHDELTDAELLAAAQPIALSYTEGVPQLDKVFLI